jgi:hypothetical protein
MGTQAISASDAGTWRLGDLDVRRMGFGAMRLTGSLPFEKGTPSDRGHAAPISLLHAVTAPTAARSVLHLLPAEVGRDTYDRLWQAGAALVSVYSSGATARPLPAGPPPAAGDLADQAIATGDEHAIKLTEACLRLHAQREDPQLLHAAAHASELLAR